MSKIRPANKADKDNVLNFILENQGGVKKARSYLFDYKWQVNPPNYGWVLEDDNNIVGYIGFIYSNRLINGEKKQFANMTNWVVDKNYRSMSLKLFSASLKLENTIYTNFSASSTVQRILPSFGFKKISDYEISFSILSGISKRFKRKVPVIKEIQTNDKIPEEIISLIKDSDVTNCLAIKLAAYNTDSYIIFLKRPLGRFNAAQILYASNMKVLMENIHYFTWFLFKKYKIIKTIIDDCKSDVDKYKFIKKRYRPKFFAGDDKIVGDIDLLYSELVYKHAY